MHSSLLIPEKITDSTGNKNYKLLYKHSDFKSWYIYLFDYVDVFTCHDVLRDDKTGSVNKVNKDEKRCEWNSSLQ